MNERIVLAVIGPFMLTAYGICVAAGALFAALVVILLGLHRRLQLHILLDMILCSILGAVLGARILYCLSMFETISIDFGLDFIPKLWMGGYTLFGGVLGGLAGVLLYARITRNPLAALLDTMVPGAALFLMVVRLAEYFTTQGLGLFIEDEVLQHFPFAVQDLSGYWMMPVFVYEAFAALVIAVVCLRMLSRAKPGAPTVTFLTLLCLTQILLDGWRQDEYIRFGFVHLNQLAGAAILLFIMVQSVFRMVKQYGFRAWQMVRALLFAINFVVLIWVEFALDKSTISNAALYIIMIIALMAMGVAILYNGRRRACAKPDRLSAVS